MFQPLLGTAYILIPTDSLGGFPFSPVDLYLATYTGFPCGPSTKALFSTGHPNHRKPKLVRYI
eukprot:3044872-Pleurochrysis_carterae.AAC.1